jgi:hypothetical protein
MAVAPVDFAEAGEVHAQHGQAGRRAAGPLRGLHHFLPRGLARAAGVGLFGLFGLRGLRGLRGQVGAAHVIDGQVGGGPPAQRRHAAASAGLQHGA